MSYKLSISVDASEPSLPIIPTPMELSTPREAPIEPALKAIENGCRKRKAISPISVSQEVIEIVFPAHKKQELSRLSVELQSPDNNSYQCIRRIVGEDRKAASLFQCLNEQNHSLGECIGAGNASCVYELCDVKGQLFAPPSVIKIIKQREFSDKPYLVDPSRGETLSYYLSHDGIISPRVIYTYKDGQTSPVNKEGEIIAIIMPRANGTSLDKYIHERNLKGNPITFLEIAKIGVQIAEILNFLHSKKIVHRDLKMENFIIDEDLHVRLGDFGLAKKIQRDEGPSSPVGTQTYMPPENFRNMFSPSHGPKTDTYSFGVLLYRIAFGVFPDRQNLTFPPNTPLNISGLLTRLLQNKPESRCSLNLTIRVLNHILKHPDSLTEA